MVSKEGQLHPGKIFSIVVLGRNGSLNPRIMAD